MLLPWIPGEPIRPEQFMLPKDVALGVCGLACILRLACRNTVRWWLDIDLPLSAVLVLGALAVVFVATNTFTGWRTVSGFGAAFALFLLGRNLRPRSATVLKETFCVVAAVVGAIIVLEGLGGLPLFSEPGRAPGGTLGSRNVAARFFCLCAPLFWHQMMTAKSPAARIWLVGVMVISSAAVTLSRSRGSWAIWCALVIALPVVSSILFGWRHTRKPSFHWAAALALGGSGALVLPNRLGWSVDDFVSSAVRISDFRSGTGRGRVIQASTTLRMVRESPLMGVGPGNWSVNYPAFASKDDPSVTPWNVYPAPRIPRNDSLSLIAEFGILAGSLALTCLFGVSRRMSALLKNGDFSQRLAGLTLFAVLVATICLGMVDPILRISPLVGTVGLILGLGLSDGSVLATSGSCAPRPLRWAILTFFGTAAAFFAVSSLGEIVALRSLRSFNSVGDLHRAIRFAPANVEARVALATVLIRAGRCDLAVPHVKKAAQLQPYSQVPKALASRC
jgi:O-antigen ligase